MKLLPPPILNIASDLQFVKAAAIILIFLLSRIETQADTVKLFEANGCAGYDISTFYKPVVAPDSTMPDSLTYEIGDTIAIYTSGLDTTYILYAEELPDSLQENFWVIDDPNPKIIVELGHQSAPVNTGLIGVNLTDFFEPNKANKDNNDNYSVVPNPWDALVELAPKTIRIFSGASAKFMHPMGSQYDAPENLWYGGYGYNWKEMVSYFDLTDESQNGPGLPGDYDWTVIESQLSDECDGCESWIDGNHTGRFVEFYEKCISQPTFDADDPADDTPIEQPLYINQLIELVDKIEEEQEYTVDVIYCVNIESQSATELLATIDYLRDNGVHVAGIELGNEVMGKFGQDALGFDDFEHYWQYINGDPYTDEDEQDALEAALSDDMENDHDYIAAIKEDADYWGIKIGLPAANTPNCGAEYDFPLLPFPGGDEATRDLPAATPVITDPEGTDMDCECNYPQWNIDMATWFDEKTLPPTAEKYKFDAVILHTYYTTTNNSPTCELNSNWRDIMTPLHPQYPETYANYTDDLFSELQYSTPTWDYVPDADDRLDNGEFEGILGKHFPLTDDPLLPGNFKDLTLTRLDISFEEHAYWLGFTGEDDGPDSKEIWVTEYNCDDEVILPAGPYNAGNVKALEPFVASVDNTFSHAVLMQNWFLWMLRSNYDPDYRDLFFTRATIQNMLGGAPTMLMTKSDKGDQVELLEIDDCDDAEVSPYFLRRATYYAVQLWKVLHLNGLDYLKTETTMASLNDNVAPSVFIDAENDLLYFIYSNVKSSTQWYGIHPEDMIALVGDEETEQVELSTDISAWILDADRAYSTAGDAPVFNINAAYNTCAGAEGSENRFELTALETYAPNVSCPGSFATASPNGVCVELPAMSIGYFVVPYEIIPLRKGALNDRYKLFPNPSTGKITIGHNHVMETAMLRISVHDANGTLVGLFQNIGTGEQFDVSNLPVGIYNVTIETENHIETERFVRMQ